MGIGEDPVEPFEPEVRDERRELLPEELFPGLLDDGLLLDFGRDEELPDFFDELPDFFLDEGRLDSDEGRLDLDDGC